MEADLIQSLPPNVAAYVLGLQRRTHAAEERIRGIAFAEFLQACHQHITLPLSVETRPEYTTKGTITSPNNRVCPSVLQPWDFRVEQQALFDTVYGLLHPDSADPVGLQVFPSFPIVEDRGRQACLRPLASEAGLLKHQMFEVEIPVREVIDQLRLIPGAREMFSLGEGISFHTHVHGITELPVEDGERRLPEPEDESLLPRADQNCVYLDDDGARRLLYIIEYKAAHKLTDSYLRAGLRPMDMWEEVVQRLTIPTHADEKLQYNAERLSCAAVTQAFEYMVKGGLEYGVVTNGAIKVMLRIPEDDPATLHYCLLEPRRDAEADAHGFRYPYTAVACHVTLTLMALRQPQRCQAWRNSCMETLHRWAVDFDSLMKKIPDDERVETPPGSAYRGPRYPINPRSPYILRNRLAVPSGCSGPAAAHPASSDSGSDSDSSLGEAPSSPVQTRQKRRRTENQNQAARRQLPPAHHRPPPPRDQYCTQQCLLGLSNRSVFDPACPNTPIHQEHSDGPCHPINRIGFIRKMEHQLNLDPDHGCKPLDREGLHGAMFALTLHPYGYTFVGKGTTYESDYEGRIYGHLKSLQGSAVPVYLGDIYLRKSVYYLRPDYVIVHMGLMAWGGKGLSRDMVKERAGIQQTRDDINDAGVIQLDERDSNMLWNEEVGRVLFIDFGRAVLRSGHLKRRRSLLLKPACRNVAEAKRDEKEDRKAAAPGVDGSDQAVQTP